MGLTNWRGDKARKQDVTIAKNYLNEQELAALNNLVEQYLIYAEGQAMRRIPMYMKDWVAKLDAFLQFNERNVLQHAGTISHEMAKELAEAEYDKFNRERIRREDQEPSDFDRSLESKAEKLKRLPKSKKGGQKS